MNKIIKKTIYCLNDFELLFEPIEDSIKIKKTKEGYEIKYLTYNEYSENPFENWEGIGNFYHWNNGKEEYLKYCKALGYNPNTREKEEKENLYAVEIDKYEHGNIYYSVKGEGYQCKWDTSRGWAVWLPDEECIKDIERFKTEKTRRKRAVGLARQACEIFNQWANGQVYCIVKEIYNKNKEQIDYDVVGGYYGYKSSLKALEKEI